MSASAVTAIALGDGAFATRVTDPVEISPVVDANSGRRRWLTAILIAAVSVAAGCATVQYAALEKVGIHKRDVLVDRVEDAREAQDDTKAQFISAYDEFVALVNYQGGALESKYKSLNAAMERTRGQAETLTGRIDSVDEVAGDLFAEWQAELGEYSSETLRQSSERNLNEAKRRYQTMIDRMRQARERVDPVLFVLEDHVLFLKHNLNAAALDSLKGEVVSIDSRITGLISEMDAAIAEADRFIQQMGESS